MIKIEIKIEIHIEIKILNIILILMKFNNYKLITKLDKESMYEAKKREHRI